MYERGSCFLSRNFSELDQWRHALPRPGRAQSLLGSCVGSAVPESLGGGHHGPCLMTTEDTCRTQIHLTERRVSDTMYDMSAGRRINARIDPSLARQLDAVERRSGKTLSEIVKASLRVYCDEALRDSPTPFEALRDFIGCASGPGDLSRTYKATLRKSLERKL